jgi:hypothetical protein
MSQFLDLDVPLSPSPWSPLELSNRKRSRPSPPTDLPWRDPCSEDDFAINSGATLADILEQRTESLLGVRRREGRRPAQQSTPIVQGIGFE